MRDDQVVLGIYCSLDVVAHDAGALRFHGTGIRISLGDLLVWCSLQLNFDFFKLLHLCLQRSNVPLQSLGLKGCHLWLMPVSSIEILEVAVDAVLYRLHAVLQLGSGEVAVMVVDCLEFAAIDGHNRFRKHSKLLAHQDKLARDAADGRTVVFTEVGNCFEVRCQAACQPHQLNIALGFLLQATARLDAVEVAIDVNLQQCSRVI